MKWIFFANLRQANAKPSQIKRVLKEKFQKEVTLQKLKNLMRKIPADDDYGHIDFEEYFTTLEVDGGLVDWLDDPDGSVRCMTFVSPKMLKAFQTSDPPLIQLDTTFELEEARYKLMAAVYLNPTTNKSEVAFMALMSDETNKTMEFAISSFKQICLRYTLIFIVDKDFGQLAVLSSLFPESRILLCIFHAIKFIKNLVATAPVVVEKKKAILDQFKTTLYSNTEEIFQEENAKFLKVCGNITVKSGGNQTSLAAYYLRNWKSCESMWVRCFRKSLPSLGDNTSNRVERYFWTIKKAFKDTFITLPKTVKAAVGLLEFADQRLKEKYMFAKNKVLVIYDDDKQVLENNEKASQLLNDRGCVLFHASQKKLAEKISRFSVLGDKVKEQVSRESSRTYETSLDSCNCSFSLNHQAPCPHVLFLRTERGIDVFSPELFHTRYHRVACDLQEQIENPLVVDPDQDDTDEFLEENNNEEDSLVLDDKQKYAMVTPILLRIGNLISCHPTKKFLRYLNGLNELETRVRKGQNFMLSVASVVAAADDDDDGDEGDEGCEDDVPAPVNAHVTEEDYDNQDQDIAIDAGGVDLEENMLRDDLTNESQDTIEQIDTSIDESGDASRRRKFGDIRFKMGLKTKGRPKNKSRQFCFKKGAADKKAKRGTADKKAKGIKKIKKVVDDSESSECSSDDEDEEEVFQPDDSSDEDDGLESSLEKEITFKTL